MIFYNQELEKLKSKLKWLNNNFIFFLVTKLTNKKKRKQEGKKKTQALGNFLMASFLSKPMRS